MRRKEWCARDERSETRGEERGKSEVVGEESSV